MSKHFLIIGGSSGVGLASAKLLLEQGYQLSAAARNGDKLKALGIPVQPFDAAHPGPLDLPDPLDGMVYFPGTINLKPFDQLSEDDFLNDFRINCLGAAKAIQAALPALKAAPSASVVMFSTVAVTQGMAFHASISAAKGAVEGMTKSLAAELAPKIRVNVIAPSLTDTPMAGKLLSSDAKREASAKRHPLQQVGDPKQTAQLVSYLLSDSSQFMSGQVLRLDGGLSSLRTF